jgi:hypothetical protein
MDHKTHPAVGARCYPDYILGSASTDHVQVPVAARALHIRLACKNVPANTPGFAERKAKASTDLAGGGFLGDHGGALSDFRFFRAADEQPFEFAPAALPMQ